MQRSAISGNYALPPCLLRVVAWGLLATFGGWVPGAIACIDLPSLHAQQLDALRKKDPEQAITTAAQELSLGTRLSASDRAQLDLVIAFARGNEGRGSDARAALLEARKELALVPEGEEHTTIAASIAEGEYGAADLPEEYQRGLTQLDEVAKRSVPGTLNWVCLTMARGLFEEKLDRIDLAVADQLDAYRVAESRGWTKPAALAAAGLADIYRRAGLLDDAKNMNEVMRKYATEGGFDHFLETNEVETGRIYAAEQHWDEAIASYQRAQALSRELGDRLTEVSVMLPLCNALLASGKTADAENCHLDIETIEKMRRPDLVADARAFKARIELEQHGYEAAISDFSAIIDQQFNSVAARNQAGILRDRAQALFLAGHYKNAASDLQRAVLVANHLAEADRVRTVAVLSGMAKAQVIASTNDLLTKEVQSQRTIMNDQRVIHRLAIGLAAAGFLATVLFAYLLRVANRQRAAFGRQAATLKTLIDNLSDSVMLLNRRGEVQLANRPLKGGDADLVGRHIREIVPQEAAEQFVTHVAQVLDQNRAIEFDACWSKTDHSTGYFEQHATPVLLNNEIIGVTVRSTDVSDRRAIEDILRLQGRILDTMGEGVMVIRDDGRVSFCNDAMCALLGYPNGDLVGVEINALSVGHTELPPWRHVLSDAPTAHFETHLRCLGDEICLVSIACSRLTIGKRISTVCVCRDISKQRHIERAVAMAAGVDAGSVGSTLHEGLAQELAGISMLVSGISGKYLSQAIHEARLLARKISPLAAVNRSLAAAISSLAAERALSSDIPIECSVTIDGDIDHVAGDQLCRIAEHALLYILGRYLCGRVRIDLCQEGDQICLRFRWDGLANESDGLESAFMERDIISYRAKLLDGFALFEKQAAGNKEIFVTVPRSAVVMEPLH